MEHAQLLFKLILDTNPEHKEPDLEKWANEFRLIRERDEKTNEQIIYLIKWSQSNSFWKKNILSPSKLRKQWDRLVIEAKEEHEVKKNGQIRKHSGSNGRFAKRAMKNSQNQQNNGENLQTKNELNPNKNMKITLNGSEKMLDDKCPLCNGTGMILDGWTGKMCDCQRKQSEIARLKNAMIPEEFEEARFKNYIRNTDMQKRCSTA